MNKDKRNEIIIDELQKALLKIRTMKAEEFAGFGVDFNDDGEIIKVKINFGEETTEEEFFKELKK